MKKRPGTTLIEVVISTFIFALASVVMLRVSIAMNAKNTDVREYAALQAKAISVAEQIQADLNRGEDIYLKDYSARDDYICNVLMTEGFAYERPVYLINMQIKRTEGRLILQSKFVMSDTAWEQL